MLQLADPFVHALRMHHNATYMFRDVESDVSTSQSTQSKTPYYHPGGGGGGVLRFGSDGGVPLKPPNPYPSLTLKRLGGGGLKGPPPRHFARLLCNAQSSRRDTL